MLNGGGFVRHEHQAELTEHDVEAPIDTTNNGSFFLNSAVRYEDITDGTSKTIFLGEKLYDAVLARDYPLLQGSILLVAAIFLLINLLVDLLYGKVDPRIRVTS